MTMEEDFSNQVFQGARRELNAYLAFYRHMSGPFCTEYIMHGQGKCPCCGEQLHVSLSEMRYPKDSPSVDHIRTEIGK